MKNAMTGLVGCVFLLSMTLPVNANLLLNSDMESNTEGVVDNWTFSAWSLPSYPCTGEYVTETSYSPTHSLKLSASVSGNGKWYQWVNVTAGTTYTLSAYFKKTDGLSMTMGGKFYDASNNLLLTFNINEPGGTYDWTQYSGNITAPDTAVKAELYFCFYHATGTAWADNITFTAVPEPATMMLLGLGSVSVIIGRRRRYN